MAFQTVFKRYELKYLLDKEQKNRILDKIAPYMKMDDYGRTTIRNIYYDTGNYRLARSSIEAPVYKEKLRVRSYSQATGDSTVFVELKKKYESVVYKRRISVPESTATGWLARKECRPNDTQISKEIDYFLDYYRDLTPAAYISYEREAYYTLETSDFRVTFDDTILSRQDELSLCAPVRGDAIIPVDKVLMEVKCSGGFPLWMTSALSENGIRKTSFSKYGMAYKTMIFPKIRHKLVEDINYVG